MRHLPWLKQSYPELCSRCIPFISFSLHPFFSKSIRPIHKKSLSYIFANRPIDSKVTHARMSAFSVRSLFVLLVSLSDSIFFLLVTLESCRPALYDVSPHRTVIISFIACVYVVMKIKFRTVEFF